jgi:hypothetical protein
MPVFLAASRAGDVVGRLQRGRRMRSVLPCLVIFLACSGHPDGEGDDCGPTRACPMGFACDDVARRCVRVADAPDAAVAPADAAVEPPDAAIETADAAVEPPDAAAAPDALVEIETMIERGPPALTASRAAELAFTASLAGATFACSLDGAPFEACLSPRRLADLAEGAHTFAVRASLGAVTDATPATRTWRVDATAPETTIVSGPPAHQDTTEATFTFTCDGAPCTFACALDGAAFAPCDPEGATFGGLAAGEHTFQVFATDAAGNDDETPATRRFTVILGGFATVLTSRPPALTRSTTATFAFACHLDGEEAPCAFRCTLDGVEADCVSPDTHASLGEGEHDYSVRGTLSGVAATPAAASFTIDTTDPTVRITAGPSGGTVGSPVTFRYAASEPATFSCGLDGDRDGCPSSGKSFTLASGGYTFSVVAIDGAGNRSAPASASFAVDADGPDLAISSPGAAADCAVTLAFAATDPSAPVTFRCAMDVEPLASCATGERFLLEAGEHEALVEAADGLGNASRETRAFVVSRRTATSVPACAELGKPCQVDCECCPLYECNGGVCTFDPG